MNIFGVPEAKHYCGNFQNTPGNSAASLTDYVRSLRGSSLKEGTIVFDSYRDCALREVERFYFLAVSNYRRALDLMVPSASSWAHVTLYYSSYFAARSIVGIFGGWIGTNRIIEVAASQPGKQELVVTKKPQTTYSAPHERFWDLFYQGATSLIPWVDPKLRYAITPVAGMVTWQTQRRNDVNYDSFHACQLGVTFQSSFDRSNFPGSLPGILSTQFSVAEGLLLIAAKFIRDFGLLTDSLDAFRPQSTRLTKLQRLVFQDRPPKLVDQTKWKSIAV